MKESPKTLATHSENRLAGLDHLRALAIIIVFFWHYIQWGRPDWLVPIGEFGWTGVDLFFVLSGFLIAGQLFRKMKKNEPLSYSEFYLKRSLRIFPAYLAVVALYFSITGFREKATISPLWKFLSFTMNFGLDKTKYAAFSHAWSLCIEEQFYLLLPFILMTLLAYKATRRGMWLVVGLFIAGFIVRYFSWMHFVSQFYEHPEMEGGRAVWLQWIYYPTYNRLDGLLAGVSIAALFYFKPLLAARITKYGNLLLVLSFVILTGAWFLCRDTGSFNASVFGFPLVSIGYGVMVIAALSPNCILYKYPLKGSALIALLAFCIYLTHKQLINLTQELFKGYGVDSNSNLMLLLCILVSLLGGTTLYLLVERPFMRLRERILMRRKAVEVVKL
jgi:peptidoglycan/LPS O-acetylase OafA/YrhL